MDADQVSRLLSLTSHELRSPLGVIRGYLKLLEKQDGTLTDQQKQVIAASLRASDRMAELLVEVSAFAHLHCGDTPLDKRPMTVAALVDTVVAEQAARETGRAVERGAIPEATLLIDARLVTTALRSVAAAVAAAGRITDQSEPPAVRLDVAGAPLSGDITEVPLNMLRGGLGLRLPLAAAILEAHNGRIAEVHIDGRLAGMAVWLPLQPAGD
jgi:signal transduction histidine kinase